MNQILDYYTSEVGKTNPGLKKLNNEVGKEKEKH
jgi:hypothetical protein